MDYLLVTGAAGFIGFHLSQALLKRGDTVIGIDNLNDYYDVNLKQERLQILQTFPNFKFFQIDLTDDQALDRLFTDFKPTRVINLAAQAGVRYSIENPRAYVDSNLVGFLNILECCRHHQVNHLIFASSSSVYGANKKIPFSTDDFVDYPVSLYAATKKSNELMAHAYSHLYNIPTTGLRFFTVYGPWGRPDMAYFLFTQAILAGRPIKVFNEGEMRRDFTYVDDVVEGILRLLESPPSQGQALTDAPNVDTQAPYKIYNIGNNSPVSLLHFIEVLETCLGKIAEKEMLPMQPGDVPTTYADISALEQAVGYKPSTSIEEGLAQFVTWFKSYYKINDES